MNNKKKRKRYYLRFEEIVGALMGLFFMLFSLKNILKTI
jgi:hypothetical protein